MKVSIIIVYYQGLIQLQRCLKLIYEAKSKIASEIILVDNSSIPKRIIEVLKKKFPNLTYIKSPRNLGYGAGNNLGAKYVSGEYLFILNPDTKVPPTVISNLVRFLDKNKEVAIVAPNLVDKNGVLFPLQGTRMLTPIRGIVVLSFLNRLFPNNPISRSYWMKDVSKKQAREVDVVPGSAFMIRKKVFDKVGGFDEKFFLYFEEADLCKRVKELNWKIFMVSNSEVYHFWQPAKKSKKLKRIFSQSRFYYFKKHYTILWAIIVEAFARFSRWHALIIGILIFAIFLNLLKF